MEASTDEETWNPASADILQHFQKLDKLREALPPIHPDIAASLRKIGEVYNDQGKYKEALKYKQDALEMDRQCFPLGVPTHMLSST